MPDAIVIGSGPNGLAAAITLARAGRSVTVFERSDRIGGAVRTDALTIPGFLHDTCSSVYPLAAASPFVASLPLEQLGARWVHPPLPVAHPLEDGDAVFIARSVQETAAQFGNDGLAYASLVGPFVGRWRALAAEVLAPVHLPAHAWLLGQFGLDAMRSARGLAFGRFAGSRARALFAGLAAHSVIPLREPPSAAVGLLLGVLAHGVGWPFVEGGAGRLADAMGAELQRLGGLVVTNHHVAAIDEVPAAESVLCDVTPRQLVALERRLPASFRAALGGFHYGPGVFKVDWALSEPIPWRASDCRRAGTVHVGGTFEEIEAAESAAWTGTAHDRPFVLVTQPTIVDTTRAPAGRHVAWGYCHVPHGSSLDMTARIEAQVERFAPGFRDTILARHSAGPADLERRNPNLVGGDIGGGALTLGQIWTRPTWRGYRTPRRGLYLCSSSTPPGGGVHAMCGYHAARAALADRRGKGTARS